MAGGMVPINAQTILVASSTLTRITRKRHKNWFLLFCYLSESLLDYEEAVAGGEAEPLHVKRVTLRPTLRAASSIYPENCSYCKTI